MYVGHKLKVTGLKIIGQRLKLDKMFGIEESESIGGFSKFLPLIVLAKKRLF